MVAVRTNRMALMLTDDERAAIQDYRYHNRIGTEAGAARSLIKIGLEAENKKGPAEAATSPDHDQNPTSQKDGGIDA
jgi:hypothetical protein